MEYRYSLLPVFLVRINVPVQLSQFTRMKYILVLQIWNTGIENEFVKFNQFVSVKVEKLECCNMTDHCKVIIYSGNFKLIPWPIWLIDECLTERLRFKTLRVGADKKTAKKYSKFSSHKAVLAWPDIALGDVKHYFCPKFDERI